MLFQILADLTVVVHFAYVGFVVFSVPITLIGGWRKWRWVRNRWFRGIHLAMIAVVVAEAWAGITCPLTTLENEFRHAAAGSGPAAEQAYQGDFIARWMHDAMFFQAEPWVFTVCYSLFGALVLAMFIFVPPRPRSASSGGAGTESLGS